MSNSPDKDKVAQSLRQSKEIEKEKERIIRIVQEDLQRRDQEIVFFRNQNLKTYTEASKAQFLGHRAKPEWKKDYQYNVFDPITRDKVMAIISKAAGLYEAQFFNTNKRLAKISDTIATVLGAFYKDSTRLLKEKEQNKLLMLSALITPKTIWYEGWRHQKRTIREIVERDEQTGEVTKTEEKKIVHYNGPWGQRVPVQDFVPGSLKIRDLQEQPQVTWLPKMQLSQFKRLYPESKYPEAKKVLPYGMIFDADLTEYIVRNDLKENEVEVGMLFEKWDDRASIFANGVLISKLNSPMPFAHKDYPFVWAGFEELDPDFIYDMPLPIKLMDMQDANNEVINLTLDMVWRALNEVVLVQGGDEINDDVLYGGGMIPVDNPTNFQKLEFGSSFAFNASTSIRDQIRRSIESASVDAAQSGQSGAKSGVTAREILIAREAALEIASLFLTNMENLERDKAFLRVKNQLDRYKRPVEWEKRIGEDLTEEAIAVFREISVRDARLDDGRRGTVNVNITETPRPQEVLNQANIENDKELSQTIDISPELIREIDFDVEIVANSSVKKSKAVEAAEARADLTDAAQLPQVLSVPYFAKEYVKARGKNPDEALVKTPTDPMAAMMARVGQGAGGEAPKPPTPPETVPTNSVESILNMQL